MDKSRSDILAEIKNTLESLKSQITDLERRLAVIEAEESVPEAEDIPDTEEDGAPIDISLDEVSMDVDFGTEPAAVTAAPVRKTEEPEAEKAPEDAPEDDFMTAPKESINDKQEKKSRRTVMDVMGDKCAWRTAMPGTPVKNVISAISLNDRVLFINSLFREDPMAFQDAISAFNGMSSFAEAEEYVRQNYPEWNLDSDIVYRMMMAIRRKLK